MKKAILFILAVIMLTGLLTGCDLFQSFFGETYNGSWVYEIEGGNDSYLAKQIWEFKFDGTAFFFFEKFFYNLLF